MTRTATGVDLVRSRRSRARVMTALFQELESRTLLSATAAGRGHNVAGVEAAITALEVGTATSTLTLTVAPDTILETGESTFTATFSNMSVAQIPTGSVSIFETAAANSTTSIGTVASNITIDQNGVATFNARGLFTVGPHFFFASYDGDTNFGAVASPATTLTVNGMTGSSVTLAMQESSASVGQTVHLTATVTLADGQQLAPAQLKDVDTGEVFTATGSLPDGTSTFELLVSKPTTNLIAIYGGDATHAASQSDTLTITAAKAPTTLNATAGAYGRTVTVNVGLPDGFPLSLLASFGGTVTLFEGSTQLGQTTLSGSTGTTFSLSLPAGTHQLHVTFTGNDSFDDSATDLADTITKVPTTVGLSVTNGGNGLAISLGLPGDVPSDLAAGGTVKLYDGKKLVATIDVTSASMIFDISHWRNGLHRIRAVYSGDTAFKASVSASLNWIRTPHGPKVPPGFAHAKGLNNLGSSVGSDISDTTATTVATVIAPPKKGNGKAAGKAKGHK